jgi:hypothetical protein
MKEDSSMQHIPEVKQSKNVFMSFTGQLLKMSMLHAKSKEDEEEL